MAHERSAEKNLRYRGLARVDLACLSFDEDPLSAPRESSKRNVARLLKIFQLEGCKRFDEKTFVDALVDVEWLPDRAITLSKEPPLDWNKVPRLQLHVACLNGQNRVAAAKQFLDANDQWWVVKLYTNDLSSAGRTELAEEFSNEQAYSDGEILFKIRQYHCRGDHDGESRWWARLSATKRKDLKQLLKDERYAQALDSMLEGPGLFKPVRLGCLHRLLTMKCDEECIHYLHHVANTWRHILTNIPAVPENALDEATVQHLETLAPAHSSDDAKLVRDLMQSGAIFPRILDSDHRTCILQNILSVAHMIPSLYTFFENLKYLEPCAKIMRALLPPKQINSIKLGLAGFYVRPEPMKVQYGNKDTRSHGSGLNDVDEAMAYHQLWLYAMRNFPEMTNDTPRKEIDASRPVAKTPNPALWQEFGALAITVGFCTKAAEDLAAQDGKSLLASQVVEDCGLSGDEKVAAVLKIVEILKSAKRSEATSMSRVLTGTEWLPKERRCGRPFQCDHSEDGVALYLPVIYSEPNEDGDNITSLFWKRDMFQTFFSIDMDIGRRLNASPQSSLTPSHEDEGRHTACGQCSAHEEAMHSALHECERLKSMAAAKQEYVDRLETSFETCRAEREILQHTLEEAQSRAEDRERHLQSERSQFQSRITSLEMENQQVKSTESLTSDKRHRMATRISKLKKKKQSMDTRLHNSKESLQELSKAYSASLQKVSALEYALQQREAEVATKIQELDQHRGWMEGLQQDVSSRTREYERCAGELHNYAKQLQESRDQLDMRSQEQRAYENQLVSLQATWTESEQEKKAMIDQLRLELDGERHCVSHLESIRDDQESRIKKKDAELEQWRQNYGENNGRYDAEVAYMNSRKDNELLHESAKESQATTLSNTRKQSEVSTEEYTCEEFQQLPKDFLVFRAVSCVNGVYRVNDAPFAIDDARRKLEGIKSSLRRYAFLVGLEQPMKVPAEFANVDYLMKAWEDKLYLWAIKDVGWKEYFASRSLHIDELKHMGLFVAQPKSVKKRKTPHKGSNKRLVSARRRDGTSEALPGTEASGVIALQGDNQMLLDQSEAIAETEASDVVALSGGDQMHLDHGEAMAGTEVSGVIE